jgi:hypothetical protein
MDAVIPPAPSIEDAGDERRQGVPSVPPPDLPGFEVLEPIGRGARGCVYKAREGRRTLAVKVLRRGISVDRAVLDRFLRTSAAGDASPPGIRHPSIAPIDAIGEATDGSIYYAMPVLRGDPLERVLADLKRGSSERPSLSPLAIGPDGETHPQLARRAAETFAEVAEGLAVAHREGIVHRRLHPRNLIFSPAGRLMITDFGGGPSTGGGDALAYVAPEELDPFPEGVGPTADVYSLGVMLYEVLSRRLPFAAESPQELKRAILKGRCPVPRSLRSEVPAGLEAAVLKAMAREPADRYADAGELAEELRRFLQHETPIAVREARATRKTKTPATRERSPATAAARRPGVMGPRARLAGTALVVVSVAAAVWWAGDRLLGPRDRGTRIVSWNPAAQGTGSLAPTSPGGEDSQQATARTISRDGATGEAAGKRARFGQGGLARASGVGWGEPTLRLDGSEFAALGEAIERSGGEDDARLFCLWDIDAAGVLDTAPRPSEVALPPNLRIDLGPDAPRDFTARSIRMLAMVDPPAILHPSARRAIDDELAGGEASLLARREEVFRELSRSLAEIGARPDGGEAEAAIHALAAIAREEYLTSARDALAALAELGAHDALIGIARSGDLPSALREAALAFLGGGLAGLVAEDLRSIALSSSEPALRRQAFVLLAEASTPAAATILTRAIDDPELRLEALSRLDALGPDAARPALDLLEHPEHAVRARATAFLVTSTADIAEPLALRLLSPRRTAREAALAILMERHEVAWVAPSIAAVLGVSAPAIEGPPRLLENGFAAGRGFAAAILGGLREAASFFARQVQSIRITRL